MKTYSALSGYVYQYVYAGYREPETASATRSYVFLVGRHLKANAPLAIEIPSAVISALQETAGREIDSRERYALAKMKLFRVLDEWLPEPKGSAASGHAAALNTQEALEFWETLGL